MSEQPMEDAEYWQAGRNWNELRANEWYDGAELDQTVIEELKTESPHGIIVYWHSDDDGRIENGHVLEW